MNRPTAAHMQITSLHLRQALFLSLALLLTLVAGQLYHAWQTAHLNSQLAAHIAQINQAQAQRAAMSLTPTAQRAQAAPVTSEAFVAPHEQRWVF